MTPRPHPSLGIALIVAMTACFAVLDTTNKYLLGLLPVALVLFTRYAVQAFAMGVWLGLGAHRGGAGFATEHPRFQVVRGLLLLATSAFGMLALRFMPVAEFTAIVMLTPVVVTALSGWLLRERVSPLRWALVIGGMVGALIVIRPGSGLFGWAALLPFASVLCYAFFQVMTRRMTGLDSPYTTHFYTGLVGSLAVLLLALFAGGADLLAVRDATPAQWALLLVAGVLGTAGHLMLIFAFGLAPTATLMPFLYLQLAFAAAVGWLVFRQMPDAWGFTGILVIGACGAASAWLNARESQARRPPSPLDLDSAVD